MTKSEEQSKPFFFCWYLFHYFLYPKIPIWSSSHINLLKNGSTPHHPGMLTMKPMRSPYKYERVYIRGQSWRTGLVIDNVCLAENEGVDFKVGDIGTSANMYWKLNKISFRACLLFCFFGSKKVAFKSSLHVYVHLLVIEFFWFAQLLFRIKEKIHTEVVVVSRGAGGNWVGFPRRLWSLSCSRWFEPEI